MDLRHRAAPIPALEFDGEVINRLTVEWLMGHLSEEEREIMHLWVIEERTFSEIGKIVGMKYRGRELTGSAIRYHKDRILTLLQKYRDEVK
jgi:DNA-directed RNA polymerase specialized sigma subunit